MKIGLVLACLGLIGGCVLNRPDHFYVLGSATLKTLEPRTTFDTQLALRVALPILVDRIELVLANPNGVQILEHERWGAPLSEQFVAVLGQDIEARREDVILTSRHIVQPGVRDVTVSIDVVHFSLQRGVGASLEVRWRLEDTSGGRTTQGRETFAAAATDATVVSLVRSVNLCLDQLADRLVGDLVR